jgi:hypothetical protein
MNSLFSSTIKSGLVALGIVSGITAPSAAGPILQPNLSVPASAVTQVRDFKWRHSGNFNRGNFNRGNWNHGNWNHGGNWRRHYGGGYYGGGRYYGDGAGAAILGLGLGLGLGSMYNNYDYYDAPPPRRYYRAGRLSSAHVQWCYNRYRSYRSWDNTFQPYNGPRQQCYSPYS